MRRLALNLLMAVVAAAGAASAADAQDRVELRRADGVTTPVMRYGRSAECRPTMIVSHGLGGNERGLSGLGRALAAQGWNVLVIGHRESGPHLLRQALFSGAVRDRLVASATDPNLHRARFADLDAVLAEVHRSCKPPRLVLAGHSMGAVTTMLEAGAVARFGRFGNDRFDAYVALSPQGPGIFWTETSWTSVKKPVLMITGTRDSGADGDHTTRLEAFRRLPPGSHQLAVIDGANHLQLSGGSADMGERLAKLITSFLAGKRMAADGIRIEQK
jgi:dienelactone hydrolase